MTQNQSKKKGASLNVQLNFTVVVLQLRGERVVATLAITKLLSILAIVSLMFLKVIII